MPASKQQQAETAERRAQLVKLRRAGHDFDHIAKRLGYACAGAASKDLIRALQQRRDEQAAEVSVYRQEENERLDALLAAVWPSAVGEVRTDDEAAVDTKAIETVLKIMERRAKLNGYDMPVKAEVSGPDGGAVPLGPATLAELHKLIGTAGDPDTDDPEDQCGQDADDDGDPGES